MHCRTGEEKLAAMQASGLPNVEQVADLLTAVVSGRSTGSRCTSWQLQEILSWLVGSFA
jgi:hypothetical protein